MADHKGSPVRRALVELLDAKPHADHLSTLLKLAKDEWSPRSAYYGQEDDYPIAQAAVAAIGKLGAIESPVAEELYSVAIDTRDSDVRYEIFVLLVRAADAIFQDRLFELAVNPGQRFVKVAAANALMVGYEHVVPKTLGRITPQLLMSRIEAVAARLLILLSARADMAAVEKIAQVLSTSDKRRVLLLLTIWVLRDRDTSAADKIARMLPINHPGVKWALAGGAGKIADAALDDLGDPSSVEQVFHFMRLKKKKH